MVKINNSFLHIKSNILKFEFCLLETIFQKLFLFLFSLPSRAFKNFDIMTPFMMLRGGAPQKYPKKWTTPKGGGRSLPKIKKSAIQNVDYFEMRGGVQIFRFFPNSNG